MTCNVIAEIDELAPTLAEKDLDEWIVPKVVKHLQYRIDSLASHAYGPQEGGSVAVLAFRERAKTEIRAAANTFLFKLKHWEANSRSIGPYLLKTLSRLSDKIHWENHHAKKANLPVCPGCKEINRREFLVPDGKMWRCVSCTNEVERLSTEIRSVKGQSNMSVLYILEARLALYTAFALHSRKGYKCPDCARFIPESENRKFGIACPFEDCMFFGSLESMEVMNHPLGLAQRATISMIEEIKGDNASNGNHATIQDMFQADTIQADVQMDVHERNQKEFETLIQVIDDQLEQVKRTNAPATMVQKVLMYEAFKSMIQAYPEEMISYLVHEKQNQDFPLQARIFQEYAGFVENYLPFSIQKKNEVIDIVDLTDPNLSLFEGISVYKAEVEYNNVIPNKTEETYTGGRKFKHYGSCFIGKLIDVVDSNTGESLKDKVVNYSFVSITMDKTVPCGTPVVVTHFRIPPHYEMDSLVFLQRIRKAIVDKVYYRLNKRKRPSRAPAVVAA